MGLQNASKHIAFFAQFIVFLGITAIFFLEMGRVKQETRGIRQKILFTNTFKRGRIEKIKKQRGAHGK